MQRSTALNQRSRSGYSVQAHIASLGRIARRKPLGFASFAFILLVILAAIFADVLAPHDPLKQYGSMSLAPVLTPAPDGKVFILGGDALGRDQFARIIHGARTSMFIGIASVVLGVAVGSAIGLVSGFTGGMHDTAIQRVMDSTMALPPLILALLINSVLGSSDIYTLVAIAIVWIPTVNRVVRSSVLAVKGNIYVQAARALGCSEVRVAFQHVLPNILAPIIVLGTTMVGLSIMLEASLSFLGLGTPPPTPSWGSMVSGPAREYMAHYPQLLIFPSAALGLVVLAFNLAGDALRDLWDPKLLGL